MLQDMATKLRLRQRRFKRSDMPTGSGLWREDAPARVALLNSGTLYTAHLQAYDSCDRRAAPCCVARQRQTTKMPGAGIRRHGFADDEPCDSCASCKGYGEGYSVRAPIEITCSQVLNGGGVEGWRGEGWRGSGGTANSRLHARLWDVANTKCTKSANNTLREFFLARVFPSASISKTSQAQ